MQHHKHPYPKKWCINRKSDIVTDTKGDFCGNVPTYEETLTFVTFEDVFGGQFENNCVLYNPMLTKEQNERALKNAHMQIFNHHPMTDDDLDMLTVYDKYHLHDFIKAYKQFLGID